MFILKGGETLKLEVRDNYFDNLKGFLIICVILGNSLEYIAPSSIDFHYLILFLYLFHMPLFTFISGYCCKKSKRTTHEKVTDTVKLYLFAQIFYYFFNKVILHKTLEFELLKPSWTLWYLLALAFWYIISDYIHDYKKAFLMSVILSLILGFDKTIGTYASSSRIFFFLPFFIVGLKFDKDKFLEKFKNYTIPISLLFFTILGIVYFIVDFTDVELLFEYTDYKFYVSNATFPFLIRVFHYIGAFIIGIFMLLIFPSKKLFLSWIGKNSLVLYVSHAAIIQALTIKPILKYNNWLQGIISEAFIILAVISFTYLYTKIKPKLIHLKYNTIKQKEKTSHHHIFSKK